MSEDHDAYFPQCTRLLQHEGFDYVFENLIPGRRGERPDLFAKASRETPVTEWGDTEDGRPIPIEVGDSAVAEFKRLRSDFKADAEKYHRQRKPKYGNYFFYICPEGLIQPGELNAENGLYWLLEGGSWQLKKRPMRRVIYDRTHEHMLLAKGLHEAHRKLREFESPEELEEEPQLIDRRTGSVVAPVKTKVRLRGDVAKAAAWLRDNPGQKASKIKKALRLDKSPLKLSDDLKDAEFPYENVGGIDYFSAP